MKVLSKSGTVFWGYMHIHTGYVVKRYFGDSQMNEARESNKIEKVYEKMECTEEEMMKFMKGEIQSINS